MFIIDNIRQHDDLQQARAETFLAENPDPGVRFRPRDQLERAFSSGFGMIVTREDVPCGISLIYQYDVKPSGTVYHEIGTQRVSAAGHGLQVMFAALQLMHIELSEDGAGEVFAVVGHDTASEHNLATVVGMTSWVPPEALSVLRAAEGTPFATDKRVIIAGGRVIASTFAMLRGLHSGGRMFTAPKGAVPVRVDMTWFDPALLALR